MDPLVKELASYGIYGKPLGSVPRSILERVAQSDLGEIRAAEDAKALQKSIILADLGPDHKKDRNLSEILALDPPDEYVLRLKTEEWHEFVLRGLNTKVDMFYIMTSEMLQAGGALSRDDLMACTGVSGWQFNKRIKRLQEANLVDEKSIQDQRMYTYKWEYDNTPEEEGETNVGSTNGEGRPLSIANHQELIEFLSNERAIILSSQRNKIEDISSNAFLNGDESLLCFLENNGFTVIEITSKYMSTEHVIYLQSLEDRDPSVLDKIDQAQSLVVCGFRKRLLKHFYTTARGTVEDNGFIHSLSGRIEVFYSYMMSMLPRKNYQVFFGRNTVMEMDFLTFAACVPLRHENLLLALAAFAREETNAGGELLANEFVDFVSGAFSDPLTIYSKARTVLESMKLLDAVALLNTPPSDEVAEHFPMHKACAVELITKASPKEFREVLEAVIRYNIFEIFDTEDFLYFTVIEGVNEYINTVLSKISATERVYSPEHLTREARSRLFHDLCELSQEEFADKARDIISKLPGKNVRKTLYKKLQNFN